MKINKTSIIGMGALGLMYAAHIVKHSDKDSVEFVMDSTRVEKYKDTEFIVNGEKMRFNITVGKDAKPAELLIIAVKYPGLLSALETLKGCIDKNTVIISVMNGITSEKIIGEHFPEAKANIIPALSQKLDAMKFGNEIRYAHMGNIHIGTLSDTSKEAFGALTDYFDSIRMPYVIEEDITYRMWCKFMLNVGINQTTMVYGCPYRDTLIEGSEPNRTFIGAMREARVIANAEGINITEQDINFYVEIIRSLDLDCTPSMGQDRINKKPCEVEMFSGTIIELGKKHGILVPVNKFLYDRAREIEAEYIK